MALPLVLLSRPAASGPHCPSYHERGRRRQAWLWPQDIDLHPGEKPRNDSGARRFEDEVSPEIVMMANDVLRAWLPAVLLDRLGVTP